MRSTKLLAVIALVLLSLTAARAQSTTSQNISAAGAQTAIDVSEFSSVSVTIRGTYGSASINFEASPDATNYFPVFGNRRDVVQSSTGSGVLSSTSRTWLIDVQGFSRFRLRCVAISSGTVNATITTIASGGDVSVSGAGTSSNFGSATPSAGTAAGFDDGTNMKPARTFDADSGAGAENVLGVNLRKKASGGSVEAGTSSDPLRVDPTGSTTQPVSAASLPLPSGASTAAKQPALGTAGSPSADVISVQGVVGGTAQPVSAAALPLPSGASTEATLALIKAKTDNLDVALSTRTKPADTQPVSAASLPLPALAATSTKQSDGSQKSQVVDGAGNVIGSTSNALDVNIKSGNPTTITATQSTASNLKVEPAGNVASGASDSGNPVKVGGKYNSSAPTLTDGQRGDLQLDVNGNLKVNLAVKLDSTNDSVSAATADGANVTLGAKADAKSTATDTTAVTIMQVLKQISASVQAPPSQAVTNGGTFAVQSTLQAGSAQIGHLEANQSANVAQINGVTPLMGNGTTGTGSQRVTVASDNTANSNPWLAQPVPGTANGLSTSFLTSAASTNSTSVKGSAGQLYHIRAINTTATLYYLRLYNSSSAPTCSSATGFIETIPIPASATGAGVVIDSAIGFAYGTGIGFCLTGGGSSTDNTNAATGVYLTIGYK